MRKDRNNFSHFCFEFLLIKQAQRAMSEPTMTEERFAVTSFIFKTEKRRRIRANSQLLLMFLIVDVFFKVFCQRSCFNIDIVEVTTPFSLTLIYLLTAHSSKMKWKILRFELPGSRWNNENCLSCWATQPTKRNLWWSSAQWWMNEQSSLEELGEEVRNSSLITKLIIKQLRIAAVVVLRCFEMMNKMNGKRERGNGKLANSPVFYLRVDLFLMRAFLARRRRDNEPLWMPSQARRVDNSWRLFDCEKVYAQISNWKERTSFFAAIFEAADEYLTCDVASSSSFSRIHWCRLS